ncbi:MAG: orotate phosphoribosyltransferase [Actinobacteria bacterium]|nr:orotate phosphoribosyltransferase [Actinomycetota bacterium]
MKVNESEVLQVLEDKGAVLRGHFKLSSGRHSDLFIQKFRVLEHPGLAQRFGQELAESFPGSFDLVASPAVGAVVLGFATALAAHSRFIFAERSGDRMEFRRGFEIPPHARVLVVEDVITTGGSALEVVELVRRAGGDPVGVGALIDRDDPVRRWQAGVPLHALVTVKAESWEPSECPLCARAEPLDDPGSRRLSA